ncbi:MAG: hypothetical protein Q9M75_07605, partial [Ghiorsea sp.]|nr:hypothetical protein [Ghiorsea sp.]
MGYNSNAYHAPSTTYIDLAKAAAPTVVPNVQGGLFVPMKLGVKYQISDDLQLRYKFNSQFYLDSALSAADTYDHKVKLMKDLDIGDDMQLQVGGLFGIHKKLYVDHDTGTEKLSNAGVNVSNRYTYQDIGVFGELTKEIAGVKLIGKGKFASLNYDDPIVISSLDHTLFQLGGFAQVRMMDDKAKVTIGYEYMTRSYSNRRSRDLTAKLGTNPFLNYSYGTLSGKIAYKMNRYTRVFVGGELITRADDFVGYNDYTKTKVKLRVLHKLNADASVRAKFAYSNTNYDRAFAFENPAAPKKTSSTTTLSLKAKYQWDGYGDPMLWADTTYQNVDTNDLRY